MSNPHAANSVGSDQEIQETAGRTLTNTFAELGVDQDLVDVLSGKGIVEAFPIQELTIADALKGRDVCGKAQTGSGKTLAFGIPTVQSIGTTKPDHVDGLILVPTRELATQVFEELQPLAAVKGLKALAVYGGADIEKQIAALERGVQLIVATPGRMIDLLERKVASVSSPIHGDLRQRQREKALKQFTDGELQALVATDVAARGIHVDDVDIVIHFDPPDDHKTYLHRSGRTARAGGSGVAVTLVLWNQELEVKRMQKRLALDLPIVEMFSNDARLSDLAGWDPTAD
ncbi:UNVERIFIED_CONTAM: hypothetical protein GTU68_054891 [Idotea baltica]|nr:hypothetical protein [Idotea baltica]